MNPTGPTGKKNPTARIKSREAYSPFALRVVQTDKGVFWDVEDTNTHKRRFIISTKPSSARKLAQWILDNIDEERLREVVLSSDSNGGTETLPEGTLRCGFCERRWEEREADMTTHDTPGPQMSGLLSGYVLWLLDRDPEYAARLISRWEASKPSTTTGSRRGGE